MSGKAKVFIDGSSGTTGLQIATRLKARADLEFITLPDELRKDVEAKRAAINAADIVFLCLPDAAAIESAALVDADNTHTVVIDASTAHRTNDAWVYGMPELAGQVLRIAGAQCIANPGCHASGFIALVAPLVAAGLVSADVRVSAISLTGYSGGGKAMIAQYESELRCAGAGAGASETSLFMGGRQYGLTQAHKHLPEMQKVCGLKVAPVFSPVVEPYYSGMQTIVPLTPTAWGTTLADMQECLRAAYSATKPEGVISYIDETTIQDTYNGFISATTLSGYDNMWVTLVGNDERATAIAVFDNLGKGASGAAIQNMNIALGLPAQTSLKMKEC